MARVFNIGFQYKEKSYTALVSISGKDDSSVTVATNSESIQILLPTGRLIFSIADVLQKMHVATDKTPHDTIFHITPNISLQLMNSEW